MYKKLFDGVKLAVQRVIGQMGTLQNSATWLFDFEVAATTATPGTLS